VYTEAAPEVLGSTPRTREATSMAAPPAVTNRDHWGLVNVAPCSLRGQSGVVAPETVPIGAIDGQP
jgi:hypothetical protein